MADKETWTILAVLNWTKNHLAAKGVENARLEAEWMLCAVLGLDRMGLYLNFDRPLDVGELSACRTMIARRARREPLQHLLGTQEFCGLEFEVTPDTLIPRHDTETLTEAALRRTSDSARILDIGTGSGCIAIALAKRLPAATITASDISEAALSVARRNADRNGAVIEFLCGSLCEPVTGRIFDLIVSNPPYIPSNDIAALQPEVRDYEPRPALDGGMDGLDIYRKLIPAATAFLSPGGWLLVEVGAGQALAVSSLFRQNTAYGELFTATDPGGIERVVGARREIP